MTREESRERGAGAGAPGASTAGDGPGRRASTLARRLVEEALPRAESSVGANPAAASDASVELVCRLASRPDASGRYRVAGEVARGGMGEILRVWDEDLRRHLAMKVIQGRVPTGATDDDGDGPALETAAPRRVGRFLEEAQLTGQLDHPGIVPVHELGIDRHGRLFFTMKLVRGEDLKAVLARVHAGEEGWTTTRVLGLVQRVCEAMAYAHAKGVVHRDLKPANVMVGRYGEVFVMDWGLARVLGRPDAKDIRLRAPDPAATREATSTRGDARASDSPLVTMDGDIVGTPAYMSPEQARGEIDRVGPAADVYAVGAMLYHLLSGRMPYTVPGAYASPYGILAQVQEGPPRPLSELAPDVPAELIAICERAMARDPGDRYADMAALGHDLRAYLEQRVVSAYETGAIAELRKWVVRNKPLAGALAGVFALLAAGGSGIAGLAANLHDALERESTLSTRLAARNDELDDALSREVALNASLAEHNRALDAALTEARSQRARADTMAAEATANAEIAEAEHANVLRLSAFHELEDLERDADALWPVTPERVPAYEAWLERAEALVAGLEPSADGRDPGHRRQLAALRERALPRTPEEREAERRAHPAYAEWEQTREAVERARAGLAAFHEGLGDDEPTAAQAERLAEVEAALAAARRRLEELDAELDERRAFTFGSDEDAWWYDQLTELVAAIEALADPRTGLIDGVSPVHGWGVRRRLELARTIEARTIDGPRARERWERARASIADRDACPMYDGLELPPQLGLLPIGRDPASGLWEFWHLASGDEPLRGEDGELRLMETSGIVLVLLPGDAFGMGAQPRDPDAPNHDPRAGIDEAPVHEVTLAPFFLAKHEMTQDQWRRASGDEPSHFGRDVYRMDWNAQGHGWTARLPVEQVSWDDAREALWRLGLSLPTEAQWEYACRAGTTTVYWTGDEDASLEGAANLADLYGKRHGHAGWQSWEDWLDDGHSVPAPVGSYRANAFGLHDTHGNVLEWCLDSWDPGFYARSSDTDPANDDPDATYRVSRGGSYNSTTTHVRSADRAVTTPVNRNNFVGVRPARRLDP